MKRWHVITPLYRLGNLHALWASMPLACHVVARPVVWHLAVDCHVMMPVFDGQPQVEVIHVDGCGAGWDPAYHKANAALERMALVPDDYYFWLCDDDTYEPGFFARLEYHIARLGREPGALAVSMDRYRGNRSRYLDRLHPAPDNMAECKVGWEQVGFKGRILQGLRYENHWHADGRLIERIYGAMPQEFSFVPDAVVNWNILPK